MEGTVRSGFGRANRSDGKPGPNDGRTYERPVQKGNRAGTSSPENRVSFSTCAQVRFFRDSTDIESLLSFPISNQQYLN